MKTTFDRYEPNINYQKEYFEWNNTFDRLVNMMSRIVSLPALKLDTSANKRLFLEEMCYDLCEMCKRCQGSPRKKSKSPKRISNNINKNVQIEKYEEEIQNLKASLQELQEKNQDLQQLYEEQAQQQKNCLQSNFVIESKIDKVHELLVDNISKHTKENKLKTNRASPYPNKSSKTHTKESDNNNSVYFSLKESFDPKTTRAISKYRKKVRREEAMKGKGRNVYPFPETPRTTTPLEPMSQEYIESTLRKLPHQNRDGNTTKSADRFSTPRIKNS